VRSTATRRCVPAIAALLLAAAACRAHAGQPLVTDDAAIVAAGTCQLEAWTRPAGDGRSDWMQPACNFTGNLELSVAGARAHPDAAAASSLVNLQGKTVLSPRDGGAWSFGVVGGAARDTGAPHGGSAYQAYYGKALASWYPRDTVEVDLNLGAANVYGTGTYALASAAVQYAIVPNLQLLGEVFRDAPGPGKFQVGVRYAIIADRFEAYASCGNLFRATSDGRFAIIGIRLQSPAFL